MSQNGFLANTFDKLRFVGSGKIAYPFDGVQYQFFDNFDTDIMAKASGKSLPDNVLRSLDDWQIKVGRIKIRNLTVLETDDVLLLEEIKHIKGISNIIIDDLRYAVAIDDGQEKKAKTLIEKNGWLVNI